MTAVPCSRFVNSPTGHLRFPHHPLPTSFGSETEDAQFQQIFSGRIAVNLIMRISTLSTSYTPAAFSSTRADLPWHFSLWTQAGVRLRGSSNLIYVWRLQTNSFYQHVFSYCFSYSWAGLHNVLINKTGSFKQVCLMHWREHQETQTLAAPSRGQASQGGNSVDSLKHLIPSNGPYCFLLFWDLVTALIRVNVCMYL